VIKGQYFTLWAFLSVYFKVKIGKNKFSFWKIIPNRLFWQKNRTDKDPEIDI
jgi:hypothetical protein